jgi:hypothetical protein
VITGHIAACKLTQPFDHFPAHRQARPIGAGAGREGDMRHAIAALVVTGFVAIGFAAPASAAVPARIEFTSLDAVSRWISNYRAKPEPARLPAAVQALSQFGAFKDVESSGVYVGFIAGVISANPAKAEALIAKMFPVAPTDQWVVVRAIAYSGHPDWRDLLRKVGPRLPERQVMIEKYLEGKLPTLDGIPLEKKSPSVWEKLRSPFQGDKEVKPTIDISYDRSPELLDTLWGYYFGTGTYGPIARIITLLAWSDDRDSIDRLTVGSMAKYTLASNASRDPALLTMLKRASKNQPKNVTLVLTEVVDAAESMETTRLRKDALASLEELKRKGPAYKRDVSTWGQIGQGALALGCIAAAATGHVEIGIPCVVGGATSSAAMTFWNNQQ